MRDLTIVFVSFNRRFVINHALYSLRRNDLPFKLVVIDNGSTDGSRKYLLEHKDEIDELILNEENLGCSIAYNEGIRRCEGNYVSLQGDDHVLAPHWIDQMYHIVKTLEQHVEDFKHTGDLGYVSSILHYILPKQWYEKPMTYEEWMNHPGIRKDLWEGTLEARSVGKTYRYGDVVYQETGLVGNAGTVFPIRTFEQLGLFRTHYGLRGLYDGEFRQRCAIYNRSVGYTPNVAFLHLKEHFLRPEMVEYAHACLRPTPQLMKQLGIDFEEDKKAAKLGIPPPSVPKL